MVGSRGRRVLVAGGLTVSAFVALLLLFVPVLVLPVGPATQLLLAYSVPELGFAAVSVLFLVGFGGGLDVLEYGWPGRRALAVVGVATLVLVGVNLGVHWAFAVTGFQTTSQFTSPGGVDRGLLLVGLSVVFVLVVGPSEELFFRGVVQRYLAETLSRGGAYAWTSLFFAGFHLPGVTGTGGGLPQYAMVGSILFVVSLALGWLYDRTRNLVVPALVHGLYNVLVFASLVYGVMP